MGFKDLPGGTAAKPSQSAANKSTEQPTAPTGSSLSKQESLANIKATQ